MVLKVEKFFCLSLPNATLTIGILTAVFGLLNVLILTTLGLVGLENREVVWEIFGYSLFILSGSLLILGTLKKRLLLLLPWLVMSVPVWIFGTVLTIGFFFYSISHWDDDDAMFLLLANVGFLFLSGVGPYMWIAVFSFSCKLYEEFKRESSFEPDSEVIMTVTELYPKSEVNITTKELYPKLLSIHI